MAIQIQYGQVVVAQIMHLYNIKGSPTKFTLFQPVMPNVNNIHGVRTFSCCQVILAIVLILLQDAQRVVELMSIINRQTSITGLIQKEKNDGFLNHRKILIHMISL